MAEVTETLPSVSGSSENLICAVKVTLPEAWPLSQIEGKDFLLTLNLKFESAAVIPEMCTMMQGSRRSSSLPSAATLDCTYHCEGKLQNSLLRSTFVGACKPRIDSIRQSHV